MPADSTANLAMPFVLPAQAQKHVTHNEALLALDTIVHLAVETRGLASPPASPTEGVRYIVGDSPSGDWAGRAGAIAAWTDGAWAFHTPREGWRAWVADEAALLVWTDAAWAAVDAPLNPAPLVGVNATADATNRLAVASPATLLTHAGAGHQLKINKNAPADTASLLYQTSFSGRAEMGLAGDDDFHVKVSPDGAAWHDAMIVARASGAVSFPNGAAAAALTRAVHAGDAPLELDTAGIEAGGPKFRLAYQAGAVDDTAPAGVDYTDHVVVMGWNMAHNGGRVDSAYPASGIQWESKFRQGAGQPFGAEFHIREYDLGNVDRRPISIFMPYAFADRAVSAVSFQGDIFLWRDWAGTVLAQYTAAGGWVWESGFQFNANNLPIAKQKNAAGSAFLNLPYFNNANRLVMAGPFFLSGAVDDASNSFIEASISGIAANDSLLNLSGSTAVTGTYYALRMAGSASTGIFTYLQQSNSTDATAHCYDERLVLGANAGDPYYRVTVNGVRSWSWGLDNSDGDSWKLSRASSLGANDTFSATDVYVRSHLPHRLASYTVAGLPTPAAGDAGALVYVSDAAGGPTIACWNGSAWKVVAALGATVS